MTTSKAKARAQRKTPAWKARLKMQADFQGREIERQYRLHCLQMAVTIGPEHQPWRALVNDADGLYQFVCHGKVPTSPRLRVVESNPVDMGAGLPGDTGC